MTTRTWNGATDSFSNAADWSPAGVPTSGDVAIINAGTVSASGIIDGVAFQLNQSNGATAPVTLALASATLGAASSLTVNNAQLFSTSAPVVISVTGTSTLAGTEAFYGTQTQFQIAGGSTLVNAGTLDFYSSSPVTAGGGVLQNSGTIAFLNPGNTIQGPVFNDAVTGSGTIALGENARLQLSGAVGAGQTLVFNDGAAGKETIQLDQASSMKATIAGFSASDRMFLFNTAYSSANYIDTTKPGAGPTGVLNLLSGNLVTASLSFAGQYALSSFDIAQSGNELTITTNATNVVSQGLPPGYQNGGGSALPPASVAGLPVYRFFDTIYGTHLFTQSSGEASSIVASRPDLKQETNGFGAVDQGSASAEAVYRFFDTHLGTHFFTSNRNEFLGLTTPGSGSYRSDLTYESNSTFYEHASQQAGDAAVYRLFDSVKGTQFLTGDQNEYNGLTTQGSGSYRPDLKSEGIAFYAPAGTYHT